jgi:hypothetical protein
MKNSSTNPSASTPTQAVEAAIQEVSYDWGSMQEAHPNVIAAAALRAAADKVVPVWNCPDQNNEFEYGQWISQNTTRRYLLAIAAELEGR